MSSMITSPKVRKAERAAHPGMDQYRIFHLDTDGKTEINDIRFWAKNDDAAHQMLIEWQKKNAVAGLTYFYASSFNYLSQNDDGTETAYDTMEEMHADWENEHDTAKIDAQVAEEVRRENEVIDDFKKFVAEYDPRHGLAPVKQGDDDPAARAESVYEDFKYFIDHYDKVSSRSHMRSEHWSIDQHILEDIEFNIPILIKEKHGIPNEYCFRAVQEAHKDEPGFDADAWYKKHNYSCTNAEMKLAEDLFNADLKDMLKTIKIYRYYSDYGHVDNSKDKLMLEVEKELKSSFPYRRGTNSEIDYLALQKLTDKAWNDIWIKFAKVGRFCWD